MNQNFKKLLFILLIICANFILSCGVEECPCSSSVIYGTWSGEAKQNDFECYIRLFLNTNNSNLEGSGTLYLMHNGVKFENQVTCGGSFVSNKIVFKINEIDSLFYEGLLNARRDTIFGNLFFSFDRLSLNLQRLQ